MAKAYALLEHGRASLRGFLVPLWATHGGFHGAILNRTMVQLYDLDIVAPESLLLTCCAQKRPRKAIAKAEYKPLTQEELLAEAAQTELENTASVAALMAAEEEIRARAAVRKAKYCGPLLRYHSLRVGDESVVRSMVPCTCLSVLRIFTLRCKLPSKYLFRPSSQCSRCKFLTASTLVVAVSAKCK